ncbi:MAG: hypothetical protein AAFR87_33365, partial [Bacteroidota bacterium]
MQKIFFSSLLLILCFSCQSQNKAPELVDFKTNYKFSTEIERQLKTDSSQWKYQISAAAYATKGDYQNALRHWDLAMGGREMNYSDAEIDSINERYTKVSARDVILKRASEEQILIINEAHHSSLHRFFTRSLLKELYDLGYRNLGLEALANGAKTDSLLNERKYPSQASGSYIIEPQFGNMVREALEIGYHVFPYEQTTGVNNSPREIEQAKNLVEEIQKRPQEKFLIHCGFDHVFEGKHAWWEKAMAGRLTEYSGIDPFTIHQEFYSEKGDPTFNHPFLKAINPTESSVLLEEDNSPLQYSRNEAYTDISILHPTTNYVDGRPDWIFSEGNRKVEINLSEYN